MTGTSVSRPGWTTGRLKNMIGEARNGVWGDDPTDGSPEIKCVRAADFDRQRLSVDPTNLPTRQVDGKTAAVHRLRPGDLVLEKSGGGEKQPAGAAVLFDLDIHAVCSNFCARLRPTDDTDPRFLKYVLASAYYSGITVQNIKQTTGIQNLDMAAFLATSWVYPLRDEQRQIADFLDVEVSRIDASIGLRHRQRELLPLRRRSLISEASTDLARRFGETKLAYLSSGIEQGWSPQCDDRLADPNEWGVVKAGCVNGGLFNPMQHKALPAGVDPRIRYRIQAGDLLMSRASGSTELIGSVAVVGDLDRRLLLCDKVYRIKFHRDMVDGRYLAYMLQSAKNRELIKQGISGGEGMANNLPTPVVKACLAPPAPIDVQRQEASLLDEKTAEIEQLKMLIGRQIEGVTKYRQALIAAAVMGQFDVTASRGADLS